MEEGFPENVGGVPLALGEGEPRQKSKGIFRSADRRRKWDPGCWAMLVGV